MAKRLKADEKLQNIEPIIADCPQEVWEFFQDRAQIYTYTTLRNYAYDLRTFLAWLAARQKGRRHWAEDLDFRTIREYFRYLSGYDSVDRFGQPVRRTNSLKGYARKLATLSSLFEYMVVMGYMAENPVGSRERRRQILGRSGQLSPGAELPVYLSQAESARLLAAAARSDQGRDHGASRQRDYAILAMLLFTGLRVSELVGLGPADLELSGAGPGPEQQVVLRVLGKGEKVRLVPLHPAVEKLVNTYLAARPTDLPPGAQDALFLNRWRRRLSAKGVWEIVRKYTAAAGLPRKAKPISPHKLRHSFATLMLAEGIVTLRELQELLGHASVSTTTIYTHVANEQLRRAIATHPLGHDLKAP